MRKIAIILLLIMTLPACKEEVTEVSFRVKAKGFTLQDAILGPEDAFPQFSHTVSGGLFTFTNGNKVFRFDLEDSFCEDYEFALPEGEYLLEIENPDASIYGQPAGSFTAEPGLVTITGMTDTIVITVEANCSMILVKDEHGHLEEGPYLIERHSYAYGYFKSYPFLKDSLTGLYYTYFTPDPEVSEPSAFLWFYGGKQGEEEGGLPTTGFEIGYQYLITVLE